MQGSCNWLLLIHVLPAKPDYVRVKVWRRLQGLGAVAVKNAVYVLPASERSREDFQWLQKEIEGLGGEASICEARFVEGLGDAELCRLFDAARESDYAQLLDELRSATGSAPLAPSAGDEPRQGLRRARRRLAQIVAIDFFGAPGRQACEERLRRIEAAMRSPKAAVAEAAADACVGRTWATRPDLGVDRMASAWLILRHVDPAAKFVFVSERDPPVAGQLRFDMAQADFTHEGDRCTFEVLLDRFGLDDPALAIIGRIVHDLDFKDGKFVEDETQGISRMLGGLAALHSADAARIEAACRLFDTLQAGLRLQPAATRQTGD
jgi:hypothetical protein